MKKIKGLVFKVAVYLVAKLLKILSILLLKSCKVEYKGDLTHFFDQRKRPLLVAFWHEDIFPMTHILVGLNPNNKFAAVVSQSKDAEILARLIESYANTRCIRVQHDGKHRALAQMVSALKKGEILAITPDGPTGPAHTAKQGLSFASSVVKGYVSPVCWESSSTWRLGTWDRLKIPKFFSTITITFGKAIFSPDYSKDEFHLAVQESLSQIQS